jgi:hypothetical protein
MKKSPEGQFCDPGCPRKETGSCYAHHGCRCDVCRAANSRRVRKRRQERDPSQLPREEHGKQATYINWNCRCEPCTRAHSENWNDWYRNRRNA